MKSSISSFFSFQTPPPGSQEGLPYWILWFLLCIILLLLAFIFLRDKDLRHRLNRFLFGAKKKLIKFRLQARLKMAKRKKGELHRELGQKVWDECLDVQGAEKISVTLAKLMESKASLLDELVEAENTIKDIDLSLKELKEQLIIEEDEEKSLNDKNQEEGKLIKKGGDKNKKETDELKKEINEWERNKVRVQEKIEKIEKRTIPLFENLGVLADHTRLEQKTLLLNYSQLDRNRKRITDIEQQLKDLE